MKRLSKILLCIGIAVVALIVIALFCVDYFARGGIEAAATYALGAETKLGAARIGILSGKSRISNLRIANPNGFSTPHFLTMDRGGLDLSIGSLFSDTIEMPLIELDGIDVYLERTGSGSNYKVILENLEKALGSSGGTKYAIQQIVVKNITAHVNLIPLTGKLTTLTVTIPELRIDDFGSDSKGGVLLSQVAGTLVKHILLAVADQGKGVLPNDFVGDLKGVTQKALKTIEGVGKKAGETINQLKEGVGGLFDRKKK